MLLQIQHQKVVIQNFFKVCIILTIFSLFKPKTDTTAKKIKVGGVETSTTKKSVKPDDHKKNEKASEKSASKQASTGKHATRAATSGSKTETKVTKSKNGQGSKKPSSNSDGLTTKKKTKESKDEKKNPKFVLFRSSWRYRNDEQWFCSIMKRRNKFFNFCYFTFF